MSENTLQQVILSYQMLSCADVLVRQEANRFLMTLVDKQQAWSISEQMIQKQTDLTYKFLGAQILYQKIDRELHGLSETFKNNLRSFLFIQLDSNRGLNNAILDRLASSLALIGCSMILDGWQSLLIDLTNFMKRSQQHIIYGLVILERIPEQLKITNRISQSKKQIIQNHLLNQHQLLVQIYLSIFQLNDQKLLLKCLTCLQSWVKLGLLLFKYPDFIKLLLQIGIQSQNKLQICSKIICHVIIITARNKYALQIETNPIKQRQSYDQIQLQFLRIIIRFIIENKNNFFNNQVSTQCLQFFTAILREILLGYGFILLEQVGIQLLQLILKTIDHIDLYLSYSTFEFWIDFTQKICRIQLPEQKYLQIQIIILQVLNIIIKKTKLPSQSMLQDIDLKQDQTVDETGSISFRDYRKQASNVLKFIYDYLIQIKKQQGSKIYFNMIQLLLTQDKKQNRCGRNTQLSLYLIKSSIESMIQQYQTNNIKQLLVYLLENTNNFQIICPRVLSQIMNLIRDCTREIKQNQSLFLLCLKFVLKYINQQYLCHNAAYCFQVLMQDITCIHDLELINNLIIFYHQQSFKKQIIFQKILQGIFNAIIKINNSQQIYKYIQCMMNQINFNYSTIDLQKIILQEWNNIINITLLQVKIFLECYQNIEKHHKNYLKNLFIQLSFKGINYIQYVLPISIHKKTKYTNINTMGFCLYIYKLALKICNGSHDLNNSSYLSVLNICCMVFTYESINQYYILMSLLVQTLLQFMNQPSLVFSQWLRQKLPNINTFFIDFFKNIHLIDADIIRWYYSLQQALALYSQEIFLNQNNLEMIVNMAIYAVRHLNEKAMQKKVLSFIYISVKIPQRFKLLFQTILENLFAAIPIVASMSYITLGRIMVIIMKQFHVCAEEIFLKLLNNNPYNNIEQQIKILMSKLLCFVIQTEVQRYIKGAFMDLSDLVWKNSSSDIAMRIELRLVTWKKQYTKRQIK